MKKKLVCLLLALAMLLALAACSIGGETTEQPAEEEKTSTEQTPAAEETTEEAAETEQPAETLAETFADSSAKIGIMTTTVTSSEEQFRLATQIQEKYGADKIIVQTYPDAISEVETTINNAMMLASDPDCKAIIFCQAMTGTIAAIEKIREARPDILLISCGPQEEVAAAGQASDVCYVKGGAQHGVQIAEEAYAMGAKYLLHYSFPRSMSIQVTIEKHDAMKVVLNLSDI